MWACWSALLERLCHREGNEARCTCSSNCCDTIVVCRSDSAILNSCLPPHTRGESDRSGQWQVGNAPDPARPVLCGGDLADKNQALAQLQRPVADQL